MDKDTGRARRHALVAVGYRWRPLDGVWVHGHARLTDDQIDRLQPRAFDALLARERRWREAALKAGRR